MSMLAFDFASARSFDRDGRLRISGATLSKACVSPYRGEEIPDASALGLEPGRLYQRLRPPDELASGAASWCGLPILTVHVETSADDHPADSVVGAVMDDVSFDRASLLLTGSIVIWEADAIRAVENGETGALSSGYRYRALMEPGV